MSSNYGSTKQSPTTKAALAHAEMQKRHSPTNKPEGFKAAMLAHAEMQKRHSIEKQSAPQRTMPGGGARRFNRPFGNQLENYRRAQVDNLENPENEEGYNKEAEQAQNENISRQAQQQNIAQQQTRQAQINALKRKANLIKQQAIKSGLQKEVAKKAGGHLLRYAAVGGCGGCLTALAYVIIIGAVLAIIIYVADFLGLMPN